MPKMIALLLIVLLSFVSITSAKDKPAVSITIAATVDQVKAGIVTSMVSKGWRIDADTAYQLVFSKEESGGRGMMAQLLGGNARCAMPRSIFRLALAKNGDSVLLVGTQAIELQRGWACTPYEVVLDGKKQRAAMEDFLAEIKVQVEAANPVADKRGSSPRAEHE